ncbi:hypothetical protein [Streptomyces sp. NPDC047985]|uniref:hypothetical protein n=1 Tax=unclassified Streptomyces TaxID=2593676 RepID=UPI00341B8BF3
MKLWELRSYEQVIKLEQDRLIYQARLQARFGRSWRRKAPVESLMPLRLAKYGVPLAETAGAGLAAAGIEPALLPPAPALSAAGPDEVPPELPYAGPQAQPQHQPPTHPQALAPQQPQQPYGQQPVPHQSQQSQQSQQQYEQQQQHARPIDGGAAGTETVGEWPQDGPGSHESPWFAASPVPNDAHRSAYDPTYVEGLEPTPVQVPLGPGGQTRPLGNVGTIGAVPEPRTTAHHPVPQAQQAQQEPQPAPAPEQQQEPAQAHEQEQRQEQEQEQEHTKEREQTQEPGSETSSTSGSEVESEVEFGTIAYQVFAEYTLTHQVHPSAEVLDIHLSDVHNVHHPRSAALLRRLLPGFKQRFDNEMAENHIA